MQNPLIKTKIAFIQSMNLPSIEVRLHTLPVVGEDFYVKGRRYEVHRRELQVHELLEGTHHIGYEQRCLLILK